MNRSVSGLFTCLLMVQYGYKVLRPKCVAEIIPPAPPTTYEWAVGYVHRAAICVLVVCALAVASVAPERFLTGLVIGFSAARIVVR